MRERSEEGLEHMDRFTVFFFLVSFFFTFRFAPAAGPTDEKCHFRFFPHNFTQFPLFPEGNWVGPGA